jgi:transcriptional regulator with XRE-family HTH domain
MRSNGAAITAIRERSGLTKSDLARLVKIDPSHLTRIESGERNGTPAQLNAIARALLVPVTAITKDEEAA